MATAYTADTIEQYAQSLTLNRWEYWNELKRREREFAKNCGYDFGYSHYWETMTIEELIAEQNRYCNR